MKAQDVQPAKTPEQVIAELNAQTALLNAQTASFKAQDEAEKARRDSEAAKVKAQDDAEKGRRDSEAAKIRAQDDAEKARRQADIDKLNAQKELIKAATPTVTGTRQGGVAFDKDSPGSIENTVMAYKAAEEAASKVADGIVWAGKDKPKSTYIIYGPSDMVGLSALSVCEVQTDLIIKRVNSLDSIKDQPGMKVPTEGAAPSSPLAAIGMIGPAISALTSLVSLFKVDDKYAPRDETPDLPALYGAVAAQLLKTKAQAVYYPEMMDAYLFEEEKSPVAKSLGDITLALDALRKTHFARLSDKAKATQLVAETEEAIKNGTAAIKIMGEIAAIDQELGKPGLTSVRKKELETAKETKQKSIIGEIKTQSGVNGKKRYLAELKMFIEANDKYLGILEPVLKVGDEYLAAMMKADTSTAAPLTVLVRAERLRRLYRSSKGYALQLSIQKISGTRKEHSNFLGTKVSFSGGVVVSFLQFAPFDSTGKAQGSLVASGTVPVVKPFVSVP